jgi:hypothetical protein
MQLSSLSAHRRFCSSNFLCSTSGVRPGGFVAAAVSAAQTDIMHSGKISVRLMADPRNELTLC